MLSDAPEWAWSTRTSKREDKRKAKVKYTYTSIQKKSVALDYNTPPAPSDLASLFLFWLFTPNGKEKVQRSAHCRAYPSKISEICENPQDP